MTWVKEGGMVRLDKKYLQTNFKGVGTDDIVYNILSSEEQPKYGNCVSLHTNVFSRNTCLVPGIKEDLKH